MIIKNWKIFVFTIILAFSITFYGVSIAYSQEYVYVSPYFPAYYPTSLLMTSDTLIPTYSSSLIFDMGTEIPLIQSHALDSYNSQFGWPKPQSIHYSGMMENHYSLVDSIQNNPQFLKAILFNKQNSYLYIIPSDQHYSISTYKCLHEQEDLSMDQCIMFRREQTPSYSAGHSTGYIGNQLLAVPSSNYLSLYFLCFE